MSSAPREAMVPLTRWQYFTKTLYHNAAAKTRFVYNKVVYEKDETLQKIERATDASTWACCWCCWPCF